MYDIYLTNQNFFGIQLDLNMGRTEKSDKIINLDDYRRKKQVPQLPGCLAKVALSFGFLVKVIQMPLRFLTTHFDRGIDAVLLALLNKNTKQKFDHENKK